jgi:hypothetical protein
MSKYFRPWNIDQTLVLPPNVQDFVPKGHVSRFIVELVRESLDLRAITGSYGAHGIDGYVAPGRAKHPTAANGKIGGPLTQRMRKKIDDGGFEPPYRLRKQVVEPVFGQIKQARGFRQFLMRRVEKVRADDLHHPQPPQAVHPRKSCLSRLPCNNWPVAMPIWTGSHKKFRQSQPPNGCVDVVNSARTQNSSSILVRTAPRLDSSRSFDW